jgi:PBSX family phage terminase large subunit
MSFTWGRFSQKQLDSIRNSTARLNFWEGAVRSGKTIASIVRWLDYIATGPAGDLLMVGKTERTLKRNILDVMEQILGPRLYRYNKGEGEVYVCGRKVYVVGANDERAEGKIRGMTLAGAYGDEVTLWPENFFKMLLSRLSVAGAKFFGTTNPDSPYHWLKTEYLDKPDLDLLDWHFTLDDNPNLDPAYIDALKREYTGLWYKRFIQGLWVLAEGAVYDMWDDKTHVVEAPKGLRHKIVGVDYGTTNPCTFGLFEWEDGFPVYLTSEYWWDSKERGRQKTDPEYADDFARWLGNDKPEAVYVDPSAASFIAELRKRGYRVREADNDVLAGIRFVSGLLQERRFLVDASCKQTIREFSGYVWDAKAQKKGEDKPLKQNDHAMDRTRYALYTHFGHMVPTKPPAPVGVGSSYWHM